MKRYLIIDKVSNKTITGMNMQPLVIEAKNGKSALKKFRQSFALSTGIYEIRKDLSLNQWRMFSSYGSEFVAMEV